MTSLGERRVYLGASDLGAVIGVSPHVSPIDLWARKRGEAPEQPTSEAMSLGTILEAAIVQAYEKVTGYRTQRRQAAYVHPRHPWLLGHIDRLIVNEPGIMDAKASAYGPGYGEPGTDQVPPHVRTQLIAYLGLSGRQWADVALLRNLTLRLYRVEADPEMWDALVDAAVEFWGRVQSGIPPEVDGTDAYRRHLSSRWPRDTGEERVATPEQALLVDELRTATEAVRLGEAHKALLENRIREAMGTATALLAPAGVVTWRQEAPRTEWKQVAYAMAEATGADVAAYAERDKADREGPRVLRVRWQKGED